MRWYLLIFLTVLLSSCGSTPTKTEIVEKYNTRLYVIPESLTEPVTASKPPSVDEYTQADAKRRESLLTTLISHLYQDINKANTKLKDIRALQTKQQAAMKGSSNVEIIR